MTKSLRRKLDILPASYDAALAQRAQINQDITRIEAQLADLTRATRAVSVDAYDQWRLGAEQALRLAKRRKRLLGDWLVLNEPSLFRQAYDLLKTLAGEVDFDEDETVLLKELHEYFAESPMARIQKAK